MTNIVEAPAEWVAGIYQLETNDPVMGGADGIDNLQATQLAKRTAYLKEQVESAQGGLTAHEAAADPHPVYLTSAEGDAKVAAAVAALVAASPATLDTLNELALALGNDPNFAATLTGLLALKAPLASPALTGTPTAPTPAQFDSTTKVATMGALQRALGNFSSVDFYTSGATLTASQAGKMIDFYGSSPGTLTLPDSTTIQHGGAFNFTNLGAANLTVSCGGNDTIAIPGGGTTSIVIQPGETLTLVGISTTTWLACVGTALLKYTASFSASLAASGYQKLPSGLIVQWGGGTCLGTGPLTVSFPIAFPSQCLSIVASVNTTNPRTMGAYAINSSSFSVASYELGGAYAAEPFKYIATGN